MHCVNLQRKTTVLHATWIWGGGEGNPACLGVGIIRQKRRSEIEPVTSMDLEKCSKKNGNFETGRVSV